MSVLFFLEGICSNNPWATLVVLCNQLSHTPIFYPWLSWKDTTWKKKN